MVIHIHQSCNSLHCFSALALCLYCIGITLLSLVNCSITALSWSCILSCRCIGSLQIQLVSCDYTCYSAVPCLSMHVPFFKSPFSEVDRWKSAIKFVLFNVTAVQFSRKYNNYIQTNTICFTAIKIEPTLKNFHSQS